MGLRRLGLDDGSCGAGILSSPPLPGQICMISRRPFRNGSRRGHSPTKIQSVRNSPSIILSVTAMALPFSIGCLWIWSGSLELEAFHEANPTSSGRAAILSRFPESSAA